MQRASQGCCSLLLLLLLLGCHMLLLSSHLWEGLWQGGPLLDQPQPRQQVLQMALA